jgi:threonine aldolase
LIALENTHNMAGGTVYPTATVRRICQEASGRNILVHMDGARIFNAAACLNEDVADMTVGCSSVQFCVSKGLGAPVGSVIVGTREFIERCRSLRKMLGGGMRQAGVLAAAAIVALQEGPQRLAVDHENARRLARRLAAIPGIKIDPDRVQTNIVIFEIANPKLASAPFLEALEKRKVRALPVDVSRVRMVTHLHIGEADVDSAANAVADVMGEHD